jgi:hypothetical protein
MTMIIVRTETRCKWGRADEVLASMKATYEQMQGQLPAVKGVRLLTDMSGAHDTIVIEAEIESMDAYFAMLDAIFASPEHQARQAEILKKDPATVSAERTFYKVEAVYE